MLHNEARELLVQGYEAAHDAKGIAKAYSVSKWTVTGWRNTWYFWTGALIPKSIGPCPLEYAADNGRSFFHSPGWGESIYNLPGRNNRRTFCPVFERDFTSDPPAG